MAAALKISNMIIPQANCLTDIDIIWYSDVYWPSQLDLLPFPIFQMAAILKIKKCDISLTASSILTKDCMVMHPLPSDLKLTCTCKELHLKLLIKQQILLVKTSQV